MNLEDLFCLPDEDNIRHGTDAVKEHALTVYPESKHNNLFFAAVDLKAFSNKLKLILPEEDPKEIDKVYAKLCNDLIITYKNSKRSIEEVYRDVRQEFLDHFDSQLSELISYQSLKYNKSLVLTSIEKSYKNNPAVEISKEAYDTIVHLVKTEYFLDKLYEWKALYFSHVK